MSARILLALFLFALASCGGGGSSPPPATLSYAGSPRVTEVGMPLTPLEPTVSGTLSAFTISPPPTAGVGIDGSTGEISGTPSAISPQTSYTVYATSPGGPVTAQITLTVTDHPPSGLAYPAAAVTYSAAVPARTLQPTIAGGAVTGWSVSPALPPGLTLNTTDGSIAGTPAVPTAAASYVVTAQNSGGKSTFTLKVEVDGGVLLNLAHQTALLELRFSNARALSLDRSGHWVLWNYDTAAMIVSGDNGCGPGLESGNTCVAPLIVDLAGPTLVIRTQSNFEVYDSGTGDLLARIPSLVNWWALASDGSYIAAGNHSSLFAWSPAGAVLFTKTGDYSGAQAFAAPAQLRVAQGPAGQSVIETVSVPGGTSTTGPAFNGQFGSWFTDGGRFLITTGTTVLVYSSDSVQQAAAILPSTGGLAGVANWFWTQTPAALSVYGVGAGSTPAATYVLTPQSTVVPSGTTIGLLSSASAVVSVIDLSGTSPSRMDYNAPQLSPVTYAAHSASAWMLGYANGVVFDGATASGTPRYFGFGAASSVVAGTDHIAVATAIGQVLFFDAQTLAQEGSIPFQASRLSASADGSVLAAMGVVNVSSTVPDWSVPIYSLPAGTALYSWPYPAAGVIQPLDIALSPSGALLGQDLVGGSPTGSVTQQVNPATGGAAVLSVVFVPTVGAFPGIPVMRLSTDDVHFANSGWNGSIFSPPTGNMYQNGSLVAGIPWPAGWIDTAHLLVNQYQPDEFHNFLYYSGCEVIGLQGQVTGTCKVAQEVTQFQSLTADSIYAANLNSIVVPSTGAVTWMSGNELASATFGALSNGHAIFVSGARVLVQSY